MSSEPSSSDDGPSSGYAGHAARGVVWTVAQKWVIRITGFVTIAILTRLLSPADFGLVAIVLSILPLLQLLADLGFTTYILQAERASQRTLSTVFWYSSLAGLVLTLGLVALAPVVGWMLATPDAVDVVRGMAPIALCVTLGAVPITLLRRRLQFRLIAIQSVIAGAISQVVAIALALLGYGVWALVWQTLAYQIVATLLAWITTRWMPTLTFSWIEFVTMARFGFKVVGIEIVAMLRIWAENALIVATLGTTGLGFMSIAQRLVQIAQDLTTSALVPVSLVVFAQIRESISRLRAGYLRAQTVSYAAVIPVMLLIAVGAPWMVPIVFGDQWGVSVQPAQALALAGILTIGAYLDQGLYYGLGKPGRWFLYALIIDILTVLTTWALVANGLLAVAVGFVGVALVATIVRWLLIGPLLESTWWRVAGPFLRAMPPALLAAAAGIGVGALVNDLHNVIALLLVGTAILAAYLVSVRWLAPAAWSELVRLVRSLLSRSRRRAGEVEGG